MKIFCFGVSLALICLMIGSLQDSVHIGRLQGTVSVMSEEIGALMTNKNLTPTNLSTTTAWIGHPVTSDGNPYTPVQGWLPHYVIGLRSDGVVVWKLTTNSL